jgi:hypothetical protein
MIKQDAMMVRNAVILLENEKVHRIKRTNNDDINRFSGKPAQSHSQT